MGGREFEELLGRVLQWDFSAGTEAFRDRLLDRCLAELDADERAIELDDDDLELLAAAGGPSALTPGDPFSGGSAVDGGSGAHLM